MYGPGGSVCSTARGGLETAGVGVVDIAAALAAAAAASSFFSIGDFVKGVYVSSSAASVTCAMSDWRLLLLRTQFPHRSAT